MDSWASYQQMVGTFHAQSSHERLWRSYLVLQVLENGGHVTGVIPIAMVKAGGEGAGETKFPQSVKVHALDFVCI